MVTWRKKKSKSKNRNAKNDPILKTNETTVTRTDQKSFQLNWRTESSLECKTLSFDYTFFPEEPPERFSKTHLWAAFREIFIRSGFVENRIKIDPLLETWFSRKSAITRSYYTCQREAKAPLLLLGVFVEEPYKRFFNRISQPHLGEIDIRGGLVRKCGQNWFVARNLFLQKS